VSEPGSGGIRGMNRVSIVSEIAKVQLRKMMAVQRRNFLLRVRDARRDIPNSGIVYSGHAILTMKSGPRLLGKLNLKVIIRSLLLILQ